MPDRNHISSNILNQIKKHAIYCDWYIAFNGKSKGNRHLFRVAKIAKYLAIREGGFKDIVEAGAWLHDIGLTIGNDDNPNKIYQIAYAYLRTLPIEETIIKQIAECVASHEGTKEAESLESKIVHDADVLDKTGLLGVIRHSWKTVNLLNPQASGTELFETVYSHLLWRNSRLYTKTAKKIAKRYNQNLINFFEKRGLALQILRKIKYLAKQGKTTEQIASIVKKDDSSFANDLSLQLACRYFTKI